MNDASSRRSRSSGTTSRKPVGPEPAADDPLAESAGEPSKIVRLSGAQILAWGLALLIVLPVESSRLFDSLRSPGGIFGWFFNVNVDTTAFVPWLLVAPWFFRRRARDRASSAGRCARWGQRLLALWRDSAEETSPRGSRRRACLYAAIVFGLGVGASIGVGRLRVLPSDPARFSGLPAAIHDENSYLFQAETLLAGHWSFPSHAEFPRLFDEVHVLNEGRFASRYYPGTGAWLAPFVAIGHPVWGLWLASGLTAMFLFWAGRELGGNGVGLLSGVMTAVSPGIAVFANLYLAHLPGLVGLSAFLFAFLRMIRTNSIGSAFAAGAGLSFAMLCRPMTAAGFALPFGLWMAWSLIGPRRWSSDPYSRLLRWKSALGMAVPLAAGLAVMVAYNRDITGSWTIMPYQLYTDIYSPRHVYGFNNVVRGEAKLGPKVLEDYDRWAENLTPARAVVNVRNRVIASLQWTVGIVPLLTGLVVFFAGVPDRAGGFLAGRWWLIPASIVSLHAVHVPYWLDGMLHYHYVFESGPMLVLMLVAATDRAAQSWNHQNRLRMPVWWLGLLITAFLPLYVSFDTVLPMSRAAAGVNHLGYTRLQMRDFRKRVDQTVTRRPALVLVDQDPANLHLDYIVNPPSLDAATLLGRFKPRQTNLADILAAFPERAIYRVDPQTSHVEFLRSPLNRSASDRK